ncbi:hypothetical protein TrST_g6653 [Triparma strigata]|uniref:Uncharacterized protein n=1 Tax=Triparma strigata TaxID=1606541 RepID=A0A9W7ARY1_9STRA|nr:hypothetical protein TrST_g6653 [Triparma strigata]
MRKTAAKYTGAHGFFSRKYSSSAPPSSPSFDAVTEASSEVLRRRIAAIEAAREQALSVDSDMIKAREKLKDVSKDAAALPGASPSPAAPTSPSSSTQANTQTNFPDEIRLPQTTSPPTDPTPAELAQLNQQVINLTAQMSGHRKAMNELQRQKDMLQNRLNPLSNATFIDDTLIDRYIESLTHDNRLTLLNHTELWEDVEEEDDEEPLGEDLFSASPNSAGISNSGGSWLLRQHLGRDKSIGEKLGETVETVTYRVVCKSLMQSLSSAIGSLHGIPIMDRADIRLYLVPSPHVQLPGGTNPDAAAMYAANMLQAAIQRSSKGPRKYHADKEFFLRDAVTETLLSHCQISAPLLKLFPIALQRALLGNILSIVTALISDTADGARVRILGHQLTLHFSPVGERDALGWITNMRNAAADKSRTGEEFEKSVREIGSDIAKSLKFLDKFHHRALGSGLLRVQIANMLARLILTLVDDILTGAKFDLWPNGGGPRVLAGLELRGENDRDQIAENTDGGDD